MTRIMILSGAGDYSDPWHPFPETSTLIGDALAPLGAEITVRSEVEDALASLDGTLDLVIANIGNPGPLPPPAAAQSGFRRHLASGAGLLAVHSSVTAFDEWGEWEQAIGGRWVRGTSFHPPKGACRIHVTEELSAVADFDTVDERYTELRMAPDITVLATQTEAGRQYPVAWLAAPHRGAITLGHDSEAYVSAGARELLLAVARLTVR